MMSVLIVYLGKISFDLTHSEEAPLVRKMEMGMATHSSILAWRIPWAEEPGGLQSKGSQSWRRLKQLSAHVCTEKRFPP